MSDTLGLKGVHFFVTGAAGGIGAAIVTELLAAGAIVTAHDRTLTLLEAKFGSPTASTTTTTTTTAADGTTTTTTKTVTSKSGTGASKNSLLNYVAGDIQNELSIASAFKDAIAFRPGTPPSVLVANAGIASEGQPVPIVDMPLSKWKATYSNNVDGTFLTIREFLRSCVREHKLTENVAVVLTGSETAVFGQAGYADYASGKAALQYGLVRTLKNEITRLAPKARVNAVAPGWVQTPMIGDRLQDPRELYVEAQATVALRKIAKPEDVARLVVFLASEKYSGHISGQCISVDGGMEGRVLYQPEECINMH